MSRIRDIANLFSTSTDAATDAEVAAAISAHNTSANGHVKRGNTASRPASPSAGDVYANTETGFMEIYTGATYGWEQIGGISSTVTGVTATNQGTGRAFNNGQASIAFTPGTIVGRSYTATSSPGGFTATGSSSPLTVTGLQSSTQYTYSVTSTNNYGTSAASAASSSITATTVPQAPTIGTAEAANAEATLTFTAGATGGSSITNYKYSTDNSTYTAFDPVQTSSPLTISGLTNEQSYSFYLKAVNANGDSAASAVSNSVIPVAAGFESIATVTVTSATDTISFTSIPSGYSHLQIRCISRMNVNGVSGWALCRVNNDATTSNYAVHFMSAAPHAGSNYVEHIYDVGNYGGYFFAQHIAGNTNQSNYYSPTLFEIYDYSNTNKFKVMRNLTGFLSNAGSETSIRSVSGLYRSTSAINRLDFISQGGNYMTNSTFALYGIKAAS